MTDLEEIPASPPVEMFDISLADGWRFEARPQSWLVRSPEGKEVEIRCKALREELVRTRRALEDAGKSGELNAFGVLIGLARARLAAPQ